jgi:hypothetical protein
MTLEKKNPCGGSSFYGSERVLKKKNRLGVSRKVLRALVKEYRV